MVGQNQSTKVFQKMSVFLYSVWTFDRSFKSTFHSMVCVTSFNTYPLQEFLWDANRWGLPPQKQLDLAKQEFVLSTESNANDPCSRLHASPLSLAIERDKECVTVVISTTPNLPYAILYARDMVTFFVKSSCNVKLTGRNWSWFRDFVWVVLRLKRSGQHG